MKEIRKVDRMKLRKSIIHGDINESNILVKGNKLTAIIDWDDAHKDYVVFEIAIFIAHMLVAKREVKKQDIKLFMKEYQKQIKLKNEEKKALYYFIKNRYLAVILWCALEKRRHKDQKKQIDKWVSRTIEEYKNFNKLTLEEFLELC